MLHEKNYSPNQKTNITQHELPLCESFEDINSGTKPPSYTPVFPRRIRNQLPMIPIKLFGRNEHFECYALLDSCSTISYAFDPMVIKLNAPQTSSETTLNVSTAFGDSSMEAKLVQLDIGLFRSQRPLFRLNYGYSIKNWHFDDAPVTQLNEVCSKYPHLQHINFPQLENNKIQVLLEIDATQYILEREFLQGPKNTPFAIRSLLGWTITGPIKFDNDKPEKTNFLSDSFEAFDREMSFSTEDDEDPLAETVTSFWKIDTSGTENEDEISLFKNDQRAVEILNNTVRHTGERYEICLLWREKVTLENNYPVAKAQVQSIDKKLKKDKALKDMYQKTLDTDLEKGYVKSVTFSDTTPDRVWYLPHHPVTNPNKPGKVRRVSNATSTFKGNSLNSNLLTGPDLLNNLVGLLLRFREKPVAITADIEAMFMQVGIIETDQPSMRFLWPTERSRKQFQYTRLVFGARCSPTTAIFVLQKTASDFSPNQAVKDLVYNSFYMDDFVHSFERIQKAKDKTALLKKTFSKGGFNLTNFVSNERSAIQDLDDSKENDENCHRVLGVHWNKSVDRLFHKKPSKFDNNGNSYSIRKLLSIIACLFDPLGIIAPLVITLKIILQDVWKEGLAWDDPLPLEKRILIQKWIDKYQSAPPIELPRCINPKSSANELHELHIFSDASQLAYGAVAYIRTSSENDVSCSFLISKAKVAPIKQLSIPKMELQAAVLGTRLARIVKTHQNILFKETVFWCDSTAVLAWIKSSDKLKVYVSNRVREIQENSSSDSWYHISGKHNPADHVSRGIDPDELPKLWLTPPSFLFEPKDSWNKILSAEKTNVTTIQQPVNAVIDIERFSKWTKLLKATAQVFRFLDIIKTKQKTALNCTDIEKSRSHLFKASQQNSFGTSICLMKQKKSLPTKDKLLELSPFLQDNILRVGGRTKRSTLCYNTKHPIILNAKEFITRLFLIKCHEICMHFGTEYVKNYVQQNFYVFGLRDALRSITYRCFDCRRFKGQGLQPPMADLPDIRFPQDQSPGVFTNVGVDYIGPFTVIQRDKEEKAYICLFNCLVTRAAHLEVTEDLTTTTCMTAIRRFIARRGQPRLLLSDNGSNFLGARKQIRRQPLKLDHGFIRQKLMNDSVEWRLNPPSAPHFGGVCERLIQIVKRALFLNLGSAKLTWDVFSTIVIETESLVNARPLTHVRSDIEDEDPLTPNHFLIGRAFPNVPACVFKETPTIQTKTWTQVRQRFEAIWKRLLKEYIPTLNTRKKWLKPDAKLEVNDVVWVLEEWTPRGIWPLGRVTRTFTGPDKTARSCEVKTALGFLTRPAVKLAHVFPKTPPAG